MLTLKNILSKYKYPLYSLIIASLLFVAVYIFRGVIPFGENIFGLSDFLDQYIPYARQFQKMLQESELSAISWSSAAGSDFLTTYAYYLTSPTYLLLGLLSEKGLYYFMNYLVVIRFSLIAFSFGWFLLKQYKIDGYINTTFSLIYTFCMFLTINSWNIMWLESLIIFPFLLYSLIHRNWKVYTPLLALSIWCNFYISLIICIALFVVFVATLKKSNIISDILWFVGSSVIASLITAVIMLPVGLSMIGKTSMAVYPEWFTILKNPFKALSNLFMLGKGKLTTDLGYAPLYCGLGTILLFPQIISTKTFSRKEKLFFGISAIVLLISTQFPILNFILNGFHVPIGIPNRFLFLYAFILTITVARLLHNKKFLDKKTFRMTLIICFILLICSQLSLMIKIANGIVLIIYALLILKDKHRLLVFLMFCEVIIVTFISLSKVIYSNEKIEPIIKEAQVYNYEPYEQSMAAIIKYKNINDYLDIPSFTGFSSTINKEYQNITKLGFATGHNAIEAFGLYHINTSLLGIKTYYIQNGYGFLEWQPIKERTEILDLCLNDRPVSRVHVLPESIKNVKMDKDAATNLNNISNVLGGPEIFARAYPEIEYLKSDIEESAGFSWEVETYEVSLPKGRYSIVSETRPFKIASSKPEQEKEDYANTTNLSMEILRFRQDESWFHVYYIQNEDMAMDVNSYKNRKDPSKYTFYKYNSDADKEAADMVDSFSLYDVTFDGNTVTVKNDGSSGVLEIGTLYSPGWKAFIDGKEVNTYKVLDTLLAVDVDENDKKIIFEYHTPGLTSGVVISITSIVLYFVLIWRKKNVEEETL